MIGQAENLHRVGISSIESLLKYKEFQRKRNINLILFYFPSDVSAFKKSDTNFSL